jgi:DNA-directed RNA polymerase specialized sigma24 family protein
MEDEIDLQLKRLAIEAQSYPVRSCQRNRALNSLIKGIEHCPRLARPYIDSHFRHLYEDIYNEALGRTFEYICQRIDTYDSQKPVMAWVNYFFNFKFRDVSKRYMNENQRIVKLPDWEDIENRQSQESEVETEAKQLRELIEEDPDNVFRSKSLRGRPDITLQDVVLARLDDERWEDIGDRLGISPQTSSSFFQRNMRNCTDYIRNKLQ